jgi:diguanylate cyclase (GGDEF)-like protein
MEYNESEIFCNIGRVLTSSLNPSEVFKRVMKIIGDYFSPRNWSLLLMEENTERLRFEIVMGADAGKLKQTYIERGEGIVGWVCQTGKPLVVEDAQSDPRFSSRIDKTLDFNTKSVVCVPLLNGNNKVVGAIELINKILPPSAQNGSGKTGAKLTPSSETFTESDMMILSSIGTFTGIAAENAFLHEKVRELSMIDPLTGINNRHYFNEVLQRETEKVRRYKNKICMLMVDVDDFKSINDNYGHLTGDRVLCDIADILKESLRESDVVARFGGDEFTILMPEAGEKEGLELSERIQKLINNWNEKNVIPGVKIAVSIGVHSADKDDVDNILLNADNEMYRAKSIRKKPDEITSDSEMRSYLWNSILDISD